jgi:hypothetical protein
MYYVHNQEMSVLRPPAPAVISITLVQHSNRSELEANKRLVDPASACRNGNIAAHYSTLMYI